MPAEDIRKFWEQTRAALAEVKMDATVEPVEQSDVFTMEGRIKTRTIYRVIMSSFEGRRIRAWYTVPSGQPPARGWPAIMEVPGYGGILTAAAASGPIWLCDAVPLPTESGREPAGMADRAWHQADLSRHGSGALLLPGRLHGLRAGYRLPA